MQSNWEEQIVQRKEFYPGFPSKADGHWNPFMAIVRPCSFESTEVDPLYAHLTES